MKISELIIKLEQIKAEHGDAEVFYPNDEMGDEVDISETIVYYNGRGIKKKSIVLLQ